MDKSLHKDVTSRSVTSDSNNFGNGTGSIRSLQSPVDDESRKDKSTIRHVSGSSVCKKDFLNSTDYENNNKPEEDFQSSDFKSSIKTNLPERYHLSGSDHTYENFESKAITTTAELQNESTNEVVASRYNSDADTPKATAVTADISDNKMEQDASSIISSADKVKSCEIAINITSMVASNLTREMGTEVIPMAAEEVAQEIAIDLFHMLVDKAENGVASRLQSVIADKVAQEVASGASSKVTDKVAQEGKCEISKTAPEKSELEVASSFQSVATGKPEVSSSKISQSSGDKVALSENIDSKVSEKAKPISDLPVIVSSKLVPDMQNITSKSAMNGQTALPSSQDNQATMLNGRVALDNPTSNKKLNITNDNNILGSSRTYSDKLSMHEPIGMHILNNEGQIKIDEYPIIKETLPVEHRLPGDGSSGDLEALARQHANCLSAQSTVTFTISPDPSPTTPEASCSYTTVRSFQDSKIRSPEQAGNKKDGSPDVKIMAGSRRVRFSFSGDGDMQNIYDDDSDSDYDFQGTPLVSNGGNSSGVSHGDRLRASFSRNRSALSKEELKRACLYVQDCLHGREVNFKTDWKSMRAYEIYNNMILSYFVVFCAWALLLLTLFEKPAVNILALPYWMTIPIEGFLILVLLCRVLHHYYFLEECGFWKKKETIFFLVTIALTLADMISYILWVNLATPLAASYAFRWSRILRPVYLVLLPEEHRLRRALGNIWKTLPDILHVLVLWLSSIGLFALMAYKLLKDRNLVYSNDAPYFNDYWDTYWDLYVLVTTANNPDVMMPAYDYSTWFAVFFVTFEIVNLYIFLNIVLAVVYNNYKSHLKTEVKSSVFMQRRCLSKAFDVLRVFENHTWFIPWQRWQSLMKALYPEMDHRKINLLLYVLDENKNDVLEKSEFLQLKDLLSFELVDVQENPTLLEQHCASYSSPFSQTLRLVITNRFFSNTFDALTILNAICIAYDVYNIEWAFLSLFTIEIIAKLYAYGLKKYYRSKFNSFDFSIIAAAWLVSIFQGQFSSVEIQHTVLDFLLILRIVRVIRIGESINRFKIILTTISKIIPFILTYGRVLFLLYYVYAIVGMELFNGRITYHGYQNLTNETNSCGNPLLNGTEFFIKRYCKNNFNNIIHSLVVLYDLMIVNQWHEITNGFIVATNKVSRLYFISFHILCVVILLNIFTAFILEIFFLEYQLTQDKVVTEVESRILELQSGAARSEVGRMLITLDAQAEKGDCNSESSGHTSDDTSRHTKRQTSNDTALEVGGLRFNLQKKSLMRVESVLQQMFESEIDPGEDGSISGEAPDRTQRRLTLSML